MEKWYAEDRDRIAFEKSMQGDFTSVEPSDALLCKDFPEGKDAVMLQVQLALAKSVV